MILHKFLILSLLIIFQQFRISFCETEADTNEPIVQINQGKLKGKIAEDYNGNNYYSFRGIPYAKPPVGDLRFKKALPAEPWTEVFDATKEVTECIQYDLMRLKLVGSEDCLFLNVYTPELPKNETLKPVMVWIHGGGFIAGSSQTTIFSPDFLITEDVVIVTINFRIAVFGFLSLEDTSLGVPGNAGLKDMVLALKWVQNNIRQFNGDPNKVTIFGESAGSAACHYLMMPETAKGLFHRAILQSGVAINPWAFGTHNSLQIAKVIGSNATNEAESLAFLREAPAELLVKAQKLLPDDLGFSHIRPIGPVIEKPNPEAFLTENPLDIMASGKYIKVPVIIGYTSREGIMIEFLAKMNGKEAQYRLENFETAVPFYFNITPGTDLSKTIARKLEDFYFGVSQTPDEDIDKQYIMSSDIYFVRGTHVTTRAFMKTLKQPIYFYRFNLETKLNLFKTLTNNTRPGVSHGDDVGYIFKGMFTPKVIEPGSQEDIAIKRMVKLWTNFAKTGNPNSEKKDSLIDVEWPQATSDSFQCLDINNTFSITANPEQERMKLWDEVSALEGVDSRF